MDDGVPGKASLAKVQMVASAGKRLEESPWCIEMIRLIGESWLLASNSVRADDSLGSDF